MQRTDGVPFVETTAIRPSRGYECQVMLDGDQIRRNISRGSGRLDQTVEVLDVCCDVLEVWLKEGMQGTSETHLADMNMGECGITYEQPCSIRSIPPSICRMMSSLSLSM